MDKLNKKTLNVSCRLLYLLISLTCVCTDVPEHCGDYSPLNRSTQFCDGSKTVDKCGGNIYNPSTQGCYDNIVRSDTNTLFIIQPTNGGSVSRNPSQTSYKWGTTVTIKATPADGYKFTGWSRDTTGLTNPITITMNGNKTLTAMFQPSSYTVTVNRYAVSPSGAGVSGGNGGNVSVNDMSNPTGAVSYNSDTLITITAAAWQCYTFDSWTAVTGTLPFGVIATNDTITFSLVGNVDILANFKPVPMTPAVPRENNNCGTDGTANSCKTVVIGGKTWMAENLNYPYYEKDGGSSKCPDNVDSNCIKYGRLYNGIGAYNACGALGWHLPSDADWDDLVRDVTKNGGNAATMLKTKNDWYCNGNGTDDYGFSALPVGNISAGYVTSSYGYFGRWWTSSGDAGRSSYYIRVMGYHSNNGVERSTLWAWEGNWISVRCVKDN